MSAQEDAVVEAVARAICRANCGPVMRAKEPERVECQVENGWDMWVDEARAAISAYQKATAGARDEVIEECAKVADRMRDDVEKDSDWNYDDQCEAETLDLVASAIRSLKSPPTGEK